MPVPTKLQKMRTYEKVYWDARQERLGELGHLAGAEDLGSVEDQEEEEDQGAEDQDAEDQEDADIKYKYNI